MFSEVRAWMSRFGTVTALAAVLSVSGMISGCGIKIGERPPAESSASLSAADTQCLNGADQTLGDYFRGGTSDKQIADLFGCASKSLRMFQERTVGATPGQYTKGELRKFLERYFLRDLEIGDPLLDEAMALKVTLLGGSPDFLTTDELLRLRQLLDILRDLMIKIRPYLPLTPAHVSKLDREALDSTVSTLRDTANQLGQVLQERASPYSFDHFKALLIEAQKFVEDQEYKSNIQLVLDQDLLIRQVKKVLISPDEAQMVGRDWHLLLTTGAELYSFFLRYEYAAENYRQLYSGDGLKEVLGLAEDGKRVFEEIIDRNPEGTIDFKDLDLLISRFAGNKKSFQVGNSSVAVEHIQRLLRPLFNRILAERVTLSEEPGVRAANDHGRALRREGLKRTQLAMLWKVVNRVLLGQLYLDATFRYLDTTGIPLEEFHTSAELLRPTLMDIFRGQDVSDEMKSAAEEVRYLIGHYRPLFLPGDQQIIFSKAPVTKHSFEGLSMLNWIQALTRFGLESYSADPKRLGDPNYGVNLDGINALYEDFKEVGIDLNLFDPNGKNVAYKRFLEANLFTYPANGDQYLSVEEGTHLVAYLFSAKMLSSRTYDLIHDHCINQLGPMAFGHESVDAGCFREAYYKLYYPQIWDHLPDLAEFYKKLKDRPANPSREEVAETDLAKKPIYKETLTCFMEQVALPVVQGTRVWLDAGDVDQLSALGQYLEAMFVRFDADHSGTLNYQETLVAYPVLKPTLETAVKTQLGSYSKYITEDWHYIAILTYILGKGKIPAASDWADIATWLVKYARGDIKYEADRARILEVMALITNADLKPCYVYPK